SCLDGVLAGGARAAARPPRGGGGRRAAAGDEAAPAHHQARAQVADAQPPAARHRAAAEEGLRGAAGALVPRRAAPAPARGVRERATPHRPLRARGRLAARHRAHARRRGPSQEALHPARVPALGAAPPRGLMRERLLEWLACPACGGGEGRHLGLAAELGARDVIGIDLGEAVEAAARNTEGLDAVHVVQGDLTRPPVRPGTVDLVYSIGVLHHLPRPADGFRALARLLVPGGMFVAWCYAREGNGWVLALVDPARRVTSRLPLRVVSGLAAAITLPLWVALRGLYAPARTRPGLRR